jgi:ComEC/Rec2-related protein
VLLICCAVAIVIGRSAAVRSEAAITPSMPADSLPAALEGVVERVSASGESVTARVRLVWAQIAAPTGDATVSGSAAGIVSIRLPRADTIVAGRRYRFVLTPHRAPWVTSGATLYHADAAFALAHATPRAAILAHVRDRVASSGGEAAPLLLALLLGEDDSLSPAVLSSFRRSGTLHLLALSGMHLGVLALVAGATAKRLAGQTAGVVVAVLAALAYLTLIGPRPGLVRATLLLTVGAAVRLAGKRPALVDLLAATFLLHLLLAPVGAFSLAFGLSYASLAGIAIVTPVLLRWGETFVPAGVLGPVAAGAGAQLATVPLVVVAFGAVYPVGIVATALLGPLVLFFMITGAFLVATDAQWLYELLVPVLEWLSRMVSELGRMFAKVPGIELSRRAANEAAPVVTGVTAALLLVALVLGSYYRYHRVGDSLVRTRR